MPLYLFRSACSASLFFSISIIALFHFVRATSLADGCRRLIIRISPKLVMAGRISPCHNSGFFPLKPVRWFSTATTNHQGGVRFAYYHPVGGDDTHPSVA